MTYSYGGQKVYFFSSHIYNELNNMLMVCSVLGPSCQTSHLIKQSKTAWKFIYCKL